MKTLLEKARERPVRKISRIVATSQDIELALAWARREVTLKQCAVAWHGEEKARESNAYPRMAHALAEHIRRSESK